MERQMANNVTISVSNAYGQKGAYVARIVGTDPKFGFKREFLAGTSPVIFEPGIYEDCDVERKGKSIGWYFVFSHPTKPGEIRKVRADKSDVAALVGSGRTVGDVQFVWVDDPADATKGKWTFDVAARPNFAALEAERARIVARLAEIDAMMAVVPA